MRLRNIPEAKEIVAQSPYVIKNPAERKGRWKAFSDKPLYVEIGTGKGRFLMELAARHPENEYIGVEMYESVLMRACQKMEGKKAMDPASRSIEAMEKDARTLGPGGAMGKNARTTEPSRAMEKNAPAIKPGGVMEKNAPTIKPGGVMGKAIPTAADQSTEAENIPPADDANAAECTGEDDASFVPPQNLHFLRMDARALGDVFAANEVAGIYLNFSDPWPKARHSKRRLTSRQFLAIYETFLIDGGTLEFKTDNRLLFDFSVEEIEEAPHWELAAVTYDLHKDAVMGEGNIMTEYERKFSLLGNKINKLIAVYHN